MRSRTRRLGSVATVVGVIGGLWALPGTSSAACLMKMSARSPTVVQTVVVVPDAEADGYVAKGYKRAICPAKMDRLREGIRKYCMEFNTATIRSKVKAKAESDEREAVCKSAKKEVERLGKK